MTGKIQDTTYSATTGRRAPGGTRLFVSFIKRIETLFLTIPRPEWNSSYCTVKVIVVEWVIAVMPLLDCAVTSKV
jgi:hypothetical protein